MSSPIFRAVAAADGPLPPGRSPTPLREQQKQFTRSRIVEAAVELFEQRGFGNTTVDEIARAAGASRATFYIHFRNKEELVWELTEALWASGRTFFEGVGDLPTWSRPNLRRWLEANAELWPRNQTARAVINQSIGPSSEDYRRRSDEIIEAMIRRPGLWQRMDPDEARLRARALFIQVTGFARHWMYWGWTVDRDHDLTLMVEMSWSALHAACEPKSSG